MKNSVIYIHRYKAKVNIAADAGIFLMNRRRNLISASLFVIITPVRDVRKLIAYSAGFVSENTEGILVIGRIP